MPLYQLKPEEYGAEYQSHLIEQWSKCVDMANNISDRRINAHNIYIAICAALLAVISFGADFHNVFLSLSGMAVCILWLISLNSYAMLNETKYKIINNIETHLPIAPNQYEWELLQKEKKYHTFTKCEKLLPWIFMVLFLVTIIITSVSIYNKNSGNASPQQSVASPSEMVIPAPSSTAITVAPFPTQPVGEQPAEITNMEGSKNQ